MASNFWETGRGSWCSVFSVFWHILLLVKNILPFQTFWPSSVYELISGLPSSKFPGNILPRCTHTFIREQHNDFSSTCESHTAPCKTDVRELWAPAVYFGPRHRDSTKVWEIFKNSKAPEERIISWASTHSNVQCQQRTRGQLGALLQYVLNTAWWMTFYTAAYGFWIRLHCFKCYSI